MPELRCKRTLPANGLLGAFVSRGLAMPCAPQSGAQSTQQKSSLTKLEPFLVRDLKAERIRFVGNRYLSKGLILRSLNHFPDGLIASRPYAHLDRFAEFLTRHVRSMYLHAGFASAMVRLESSVRAGLPEVEIIVEEGARTERLLILLARTQSLSPTGLRQVFRALEKRRERFKRDRIKTIDGAEARALLAPEAAQHELFAVPDTFDRFVWRVDRPSFDDKSSTRRVELVTRCFAAAGFRGVSDFAWAVVPDLPTTDGISTDVLVVRPKGDGASYRLRHTEIHGHFASDSSELLAQCRAEPGSRLTDIERFDSSDAIRRRPGILAVNDELWIDHESKLVEWRLHVTQPPLDPDQMRAFDLLRATFDQLRKPGAQCRLEFDFLAAPPLFDAISLLPDHNVEFEVHGTVTNSQIRIRAQARIGKLAELADLEAQLSPDGSGVLLDHKNRTRSILPTLEWASFVPKFELKSDGSVLWGVGLSGAPRQGDGSLRFDVAASLESLFRVCSSVRSLELDSDGLELKVKSERASFGTPTEVSVRGGVLRWRSHGDDNFNLRFTGGGPGVNIDSPGPRESDAYRSVSLAETWRLQMGLAAKGSATAPANQRAMARFAIRAIELLADSLGRSKITFDTDSDTHSEMRKLGVSYSKSNDMQEFMAWTMRSASHALGTPPDSVLSLWIGELARRMMMGRIEFDASTQTEIERLLDREELGPIACVALGNLQSRTAPPDFRFRLACAGVDALDDEGLLRDIEAAFRSPPLATILTAIGTACHEAFPNEDLPKIPADRVPTGCSPEAASGLIWLGRGLLLNSLAETLGKQLETR